jgi:putative Mg2+ transporter-C (MgtC) family protein
VDPHKDIFWSLGDGAHIVRVLARLVAAAVVGAVIGYQREIEGKQAGARTHMLVALGGALPVLFCLEMGMELRDVSRVIQGLVTGIGFIGGGAILKLTEEHQVRGLTTAASIGLTSSAGIAIGMGALWPAFLAIGLGWVILQLLLPLEEHLRQRHTQSEPPNARSQEDHNPHG